MLLDKSDGEEINWIEPFGAPGPAPATAETGAQAGEAPAAAAAEEAAPPPSVQVSFSGG